MSDIIKLNSKDNKRGVKVASAGSGENSNHEIDFVKKQLEDQYSKGFREGQDKTRRELEQEYTNKLVRKYEEVYNILAEFDSRFLEFEAIFEKLVIDTAFEMSKKIVQKELSSEIIINETIKAAISKIVGANEVRLRLNSLDLAELTEQSKNLINSGSFSKIKIEGDPGIERGGCLIDTEIGSVDARISTQLNELKKLLEDSLITKS